jgi:hypothetical protein
MYFRWLCVASDEFVLLATSLAIFFVSLATLLAMSLATFLYHWRSC